MEKFFSESCSVENIFNFMPQGSGRNSQSISVLPHVRIPERRRKDDLMSLNGLEVGRGFPLHQLRDGAGIGGTMMCGQGGDKAPVVIVPKIVGVVVGFGQVDADFLRVWCRPAKCSGSVSAMTPSKSKMSARSVDIGWEKSCWRCSARIITQGNERNAGDRPRPSS